MLDTLPTGTVTVEPMLEAGSDADVALSPAMLRFTTRNWNTPQAVTVSASQDDDSDNDRAGITHAISGADYGNAHASVRTINVKVSDDETPSTAVVVQVTNDTVAESDAGAQITVIAELNGAPRTGDVQIEITFEEHGDAEEGVDFRANSATLTIAAGQTRTTGRMTVAPVNDRINEGDREGFTLFIFATPDLEIRPSAVQGVWIEGDDEAALVLSRDALTVREEGTASYTVKLNSQPTGAVTVTPGATGADADDLTVSPATLTFTPSSWSTAQRVTVEAGGRCGRRRRSCEHRPHDVGRRVRRRRRQRRDNDRRHRSRVTHGAHRVGARSGGGGRRDAKRHGDGRSRRGSAFDADQREGAGNRRNSEVSMAEQKGTTSAV